MLPKYPHMLCYYINLKPCKGYHHRNQIHSIFIFNNRSRKQGMEMEKYQQYVRVFNHMDGDGDGKVSPTELQQCMESLGEGRASYGLEDIKAAVGLMDSDGDGLLSLEDMVRLVEGVGEEEKSNDLWEAFKMYEGEERRGYINPKSLRRTLGRLGQPKTLEECQQMIAHFDLNGDGVLSFDEFKSMMSC